jgi:uncharacterized membrane protein
MEPQAFNDWDLTVLTPLPTAVLAAAAVVLVGALALSTSTTKGAPLRLRGTLFALRVLLSLAVFVVLLEPGRRLLATSREPDRVVVAVDVSGSMAVGEGSAKRSVVAARAAKDVVDDVVARGYVADVRVFDGDVRKSSPEELAALSQGQVPAGKETRLTPVVDVVAAEENAAPLGGVVIVSDGGDTSGLLPGLSVDVREKLAALGAPLQAPVHTVVVGADANFKDVVVDRVAADEFAFVRNPLKVEVVLRQRGFAGQRVPVTLAEDGAIVARGEVVFSGGDDGAEARVALEHTPQRAGKHLYTVQAPVLDGEAIAENNRLDFTVKLIRDRIRVLQVAGRPSWDERFVRRLLKENPSVDLISFFILRSTTDISGASNSEMSLIPFPTKELFTEQLSTFDVVIFQDFNYRPYNMGIYLRNVAEYVKGGGGFLMIGGDLTFAEGDYQPTELADVLPITMRPGRGHLDTESFTPVVTEAGKAHPITDVASALSSTDASIAALPQLQGLNLSAGLAPDAVALLTHPMQNADDGSPQPVIAVRDVEKGRAAALMTDSFWHWALPHVGNGGASGTATGDAHRKLLANTLRWLIRDPELSHVKLTLETRGARGRGVEPGSEVAAIVRTFDARYQPQGGAKVRLTLAPLDVGAGGTTKTIDGETGPDGMFRVPFVPDATGAWRVRVEVAADGRGAGVDEDVFVVSAASLERLYAEARPDLLKALAGASGGRAVEPGDVSGLPFVDHQKVRVHRQKTEPLWNTAVALVVVVGLAAVEWYWRRRRGFA